MQNTYKELAEHRKGQCLFLLDMIYKLMERQNELLQTLFKAESERIRLEIKTKDLK
jgi:hypothetical protein